jgi:NAD(P)-dependent dehydrogenase (short-subunit alcohol dehydrogenase family)
MHMVGTGSSTLTKTKTCVVTGASSGIGRAVALELARRGARVVLVCRNETLAERVAAEITAIPGAVSPSLFLADLSSLDAVYALARTLEARIMRIDALVNNAGVLLEQRRETIDGLEETFAVNYLAPYALTRALLPVLHASGAARIVNVASDVVRQFPSIDFDDLQLTKRYGMIRAYKQSKLALVLFTNELARRLAQTPLTVNSVHPGNVETKMTVHGPLIDLIRPLLPRTSADAAGHACADLAMSPALARVTGAYFEHGVRRDSGKRSRDPAAALRLWKISEQLTQAARERSSVAAPPLLVDEARNAS